MQNSYSVLVANEVLGVCDAVEEILKGEGLDIIKVFDGVDALDAIERLKPDLAILDVALPKLYGFVVCEYVKKKPELKDTKIMLMAALFDEKRYTRMPVSLYGADDYVEWHHIKEELLPKVRKLLNITVEPIGRQAHAPSAFGGGFPGGPSVVDAGRVVMPQKEVMEKTPAGMPVRTGAIPAKPVQEKIEPTDNQHEHARRLARIVVSDIVLYTDEKLTDAIKANNFYGALKEDIREGIRYLKKRTSPQIPVERYLKEAFEEFLFKKKKEMGMK